MVRSAPWSAPLVALVAVGLAAGPAPARVGLLHARDARRLADLNRTLAGQVLDLTDNHGCDRRLFSPALGQKRDVYVYLPPGYDGRAQFPGVLWLHPLGFDEQHFLSIIPDLDAGIRAGTFPPAVIVAPDGSLGGSRTVRNGGSFYANSAAGRFEDYVIDDVWGFAKRSFAIRPERDAHLAAGVSMGGFGAFALGFKHKAEFGNLAGVMPPLDLRYADCRGEYLGEYDPACRGERTEFPRREVVGKFLHGVLKVRSKRLLDPLVGRDWDRTAAVRSMNPKDLLCTYDVRPGEFEMFIGYGTADEFNIDAQIESFLEAARCRGLRPEVVAVPGGRHNKDTGFAVFPHLSRWALARLGPYAPAGCAAAGCGAAVVPLGAVRPPAALTGVPAVVPSPPAAEPATLP